MDCLEFNIHQRILSELASKQDDTPGQDSSKDLIISKVQTRDVSEVSAEGCPEPTTRVYMSASRVHCNIAFGELVVNFPAIQLGQSIESIMAALLDILRDIPFIDFDPSLSWHGAVLSEFVIAWGTHVRSRLGVSGPASLFYDLCSTSTFFVDQVVDSIASSTAFIILTQLFPAIHGLYRALISTSYTWTLSHWNTLTLGLQRLCSASAITRLNQLCADIIHKDGLDTEEIFYAQAFLARYTAQGRPVSGYFLICCILEIEWTVLAQTMTEPVVNRATVTEAAAANKAWLALSRNPALELQVDDNTKSTLRAGVAYSMQCFTDLLVQIEAMRVDPSIDIYAWETMAESLKLASVCCIALRELDEHLHSRILLLLSNTSPISDNLVQEAALKSTTVLVRSFPAIAADMTTQLRKFVTSPLPLFEFEFASETRAPPPLAAAAKCLALCIKLAPGDDLIMSNMYSLLNYIAATSKEVYDASLFDVKGDFVGDTHKTLHSLQSGLHGLSEDEKRLIGISTISVVTRLALEFQMEEVTRLTISMLLQRLRSAEPTVEAAIAYNLVDLALIAPRNAFVDIVRVFSAINRSANPDDPRFSNNMVLAAQTRLAQELHRRPELYETYLIELLTLFGDKGVAIQHSKAQNMELKIDDMVEQLASLLLPVDALLTHADFNPHEDASKEIVTLFRNTWFLCVLFDFTHMDNQESTALDWLRPALARIALKTPSMVVEESLDAIASDVEYNSVIRQEFAQTVISKHRALLTKYIPLRYSEIRYLSAGQAIFILSMYDIESMRSAAGRPSSLISYFINDSLNKHQGLSACMDAIAENVIRGCIGDLNVKAAQQSMPEYLSEELQKLLVASTHRIQQAREIASKYLNRLITSFPSLMCDPRLVFAILEVMTLLQKACENEFWDEYNPVYEYHSDRCNITLQLTDIYQVRNEILGQLKQLASTWLKLALDRAPMELHSTLQKYLAVNRPSPSIEAAELGASLAEQFAKAIGPVHRQLVSLTSLSPWPLDGSKTLASQIAVKGYYAGEAAGVRISTSPDKLANPPPQTASASVVESLRRDMSRATREIKGKKSVLTVHDLRRLLYRGAAVLISEKEATYDRELLHHLVLLPFTVSTPASIAAAVEVWTWLIAENPHIEVALMGELVAAWTDTIVHQRGIFGAMLDYSPTNKETIDRASSHAHRVLSPHRLVLQMLFSRLQASRYHRPAILLLTQQLVLRTAYACKSLSTHALAREIRFSLLLFGFETLRGCYLDSYCENLLRESLYKTAYSWFAVRPRVSFGANRVQVDADVKVCSEFLAYLHSDSVRGAPAISSLSPVQLMSRAAYYTDRMHTLSLPLKLLCEDELARLSVWNNPLSDPKKGMDFIGTTERTILEASWAKVIRTIWQVDPAVAIFFQERFQYAGVRHEVGRLVRTGTTSVLDVPEALLVLLGDRLDPAVRKDLRHLLLWAPVPPIIANTFFERRYNNDPMLLQYANRVMAQHPVELTFFFIPQVVQALRYDDLVRLGYVARFIFETAKISQLFCHQIIWNMKANCYKDDAAEIEDPMKPKLDEMTALVVDSLSGEARSFYDREFTFFNEVTSISGKLKPFIKKTKPEKKAKIDEEMAKIVVDAPFMATFKVRKERVVVNSDPDSLLDGDGGIETMEEYDVWQQAIFKVGDDCRQDVLALQVIAMFKNIFESIGLTLYLFPYRVTATAPGCGVIDVVPNATSRDEMGRAKVNDLMGFFVAKYGGENTVSFQKARLNFIQSMAAYSVACYILQIKDRHNGNIMIDGEGHIVHIAACAYLTLVALILRPGGVKFEPNSFKLNHEMVQLMGGRYSQGYQLFQSLTVKAFLAIRPYAAQIVDTVQLMLDTGLPSFKGEPTIRRLRDRFTLSLSERQAADYMMGVIRNAHENVRSTAYDEFQRLQNGIPYK
ncbi:atypical/PIKK/PI4K protein kinase [Coprinopsis cinerea okayama7|uniref:1-phosphatidylinositol 4-kinase n=1 Tax=Coprinopsis cinerea (strain Okayama-7 / 130 / ATCC MYA-4618 / FGSC 9003) TaxID=240176 RepID=D6RKM1_COPC7|nr:atypical/PIKK/PI4K protein kinase [Coprinopsis cinerea okayama7\|eukprot:XP_002911847.1 atypical/PIKK/PI4K protein kinase [Coprinopsis cinerea okayama7\